MCDAETMLRRSHEGGNLVMPNNRRGWEKIEDVMRWEKCGRRQRRSLFSSVSRRYGVGEIVEGPVEGTNEESSVAMISLVRPFADRVALSSVLIAHP